MGFLYTERMLKCVLRVLHLIYPGLEAPHFAASVEVPSTLEFEGPGVALCGVAMFECFPSSFMK